MKIGMELPKGYCTITKDYFIDSDYKMSHCNKDKAKKTFEKNRLKRKKKK